MNGFSISLYWKFLRWKLRAFSGSKYLYLMKCFVFYKFLATYFHQSLNLIRTLGVLKTILISFNKKLFFLHFCVVFALLKTFTRVIKKKKYLKNTLLILLFWLFWYFFSLEFSFNINFNMRSSQSLKGN